MSRYILLTGATGNIGARLVVDLLKDGAIERIVLLVRGASDDHARWRAVQIIEETAQGLLPFDWQDRIMVLAGDVTREQMGLSISNYDELIHRVTHVIHSAAATSFVQSSREALKNNYDGTVNVMRLAEQCHELGRLESVGHVSTAYVNAPNNGTIGENRLTHRHEFFNHYELSKWAAEQYVRSMTDTLPVMIFRPSIVLGDSITGYTSAFNVAYQPIKYICCDQACWLPGAGETLLDMVPADYVVASILHIFSRQANCGRTFHIVAGQKNSISCERFVYAIHNYLQSRGLSAGTVRFESGACLPELHNRLPGHIRRVYRILRIFSPYISNNWTFDDSNTREALRFSGIKCQHPGTYLDTILDFCLRTNWGKKIKKTA
jgi:long-chain acyl-CoA synthetase